MSETFRLSEEVTRMLADTVVENEVMKPMAQIGWSEAATPPSPSAVGQPAPPEGAPTPTPSNAAPTTTTGTTLATAGSAAPLGEQKTMPNDPLDIEQFKDASGKYFGKYLTREEAFKGMGHVVQLAKNAYTRNAELEAELAKLRNLTPTPAATPAAAPQATQKVEQPATAELPKSPKLAKVLAELVENGGVLDETSVAALMDGISDQSRLVAAHTADQTLKERDAASERDRAEWTAVDQYLEKNWPGSTAYADEMGLMVQSNPLLQAGVSAMIASGDRIGAAAKVWELFRTQHGIEIADSARKAAELKEEELKAKEAVRREATDSARRDAGVFGSSATGVHQTPGGVGPTPEQIMDAGAEMTATGIGTRWRDMVFGRMLNDPIFDRR